MGGYYTAMHKIRVYTFSSRFPCLRHIYYVYAFVYVSRRLMEYDMGHPCATNPELWFGYPDDDRGDGAAKARAYERSATEARMQCLRRCPLASSDCAPSTRSRIARNTGSGPG